MSTYVSAFNVVLTADGALLLITLNCSLHGEIPGHTDDKWSWPQLAMAKAKVAAIKRSQKSWSQPLVFEPQALAG